ncbi:magnesium transporter [Ahniella affigens]|uniref:Magnesium transporter n=1 Tax=Ahniella affigens TaxID=2021234 RepID=A0A2P1PW06_9GAMM|nr:magnesium transporter [Ahniella affigens]AVP99037.1 magnesium transporter [Ahniella affigens]
MERLLEQVKTTDPISAAKLLAELSDAEVADILVQMNPGFAIEILEEFPAERRPGVANAAPNGVGQLWLNDRQFEESTVGRLMERPLAVFRPDTQVAEVIEALRELIKKTFVVYVFVTEADGRLVGVVAFRELLFAGREQPLSAVMIKNPFALKPHTQLVDAMREVVTRHYPAYPVCDDQGRLVGSVRGQVMFEQQAFEISAQAGSMVGVEKEERLATPWLQSFKFRHPWLQLNLLTAFIAAGVVGVFQDAINQIVLLAVFLPVLAGQCGNTGCQALAVTLRGMTLGELKPGQARRLLIKEIGLGAGNGFIVGLVAGTGMYLMAHWQQNPSALMLAAITAFSMAASCALSGAAGAMIPQIMKRLGADPATASSIFLTTATDVVSMGVFLSLSTWLVLGG